MLAALNGLLPHRLQGVMIEGAPIGMSFTFHATYYRSNDSTCGKVSKHKGKQKPSKIHQVAKFFELLVRQPLKK